MASIQHIKKLSSSKTSLQELAAKIGTSVCAARNYSPNNNEYGLEKKWAYYNQAAIDVEAKKPLYPLTPNQMMYTGRSTDGSHLIKGAQYLHKELPRRIARRIKDFQSLPYVAAINPTMQEVYELYLRAFYKLSSFRPIESMEHERVYSALIEQLLFDHKDVVTSLAKSIQQVNEQVPYPLIGSFTDRTLRDRLGIRLLAEHHLGLRHQRENFVGVICTQMSVRAIIEKCVYFCKNMCEHNYGIAPAAFVSGHTKARFPHFPAPLEYILQELLKNAMKSTVQNHRNTPSDVPPIQVTICNNDSHFIIKISDRGGGIAEEDVDNIFKYAFTTSTSEPNREDDNTNDVFGGLVHTSNIKSSGGAMSGYGFGLPTAKTYADFLGGTLEVIPLYGLGTDVFLKLGHIDRPDCFRV